VYNVVGVVNSFVGTHLYLLSRERGQGRSEFFSDRSSKTVEAADGSLSLCCDEARASSFSGVWSATSGDRRRGHGDERSRAKGRTIRGRQLPFRSFGGRGRLRRCLALSSAARRLFRFPNFWFKKRCFIRGSPDAILRHKPGRESYWHGNKWNDRMSRCADVGGEPVSTPW
jgi:hypothetical protein